MIITKKISALKTAKGYRLKNSTHALIERIQLERNESKDTVISRAVKLYYAKISSTRKNPLSENKKTN
ncbi:MAG: hypothetical protein ABI462_02895 [Ignavibacteria bacterium]